MFSGMLRRGSGGDNMSLLRRLRQKRKAVRMREMARTLRPAGGRPLGRIPYYWLIVRHMPGRMEVFTGILGGGDAVLPVFSAEERAVGFAGRWGEKGWRARKTGAGELVSVLSGPCRGCAMVSLDPPVDLELNDALEVSLVGREIFLEPILGRGRSWFEGRGTA